MATLLSSQTTNANGTAYNISGQQDLWTVHAWGTFDSGTIQIQVSPDGTNWINVSGLSFTTAGVQNLEVNAHSVRAVTSGGGGSMSLNCAIL